MGIICKSIPYQSNRETLREIRHKVFTEEQGIPEELEFDDNDPICQHVIAYEGDQAIGAGRVDLEKGGRVGRVAVLKEYRRHGIGRIIMKALEEACARHGLKKIWFHAQSTAIPFYESLGYECEGPEFLEAGIPHRKMSKQLG